MTTQQPSTQGNDAEADSPSDGVQGRKRYAVVGLGSRSRMFTTALLTDYREHGELVGLCDLNRTRMSYQNKTFGDTHGADRSRRTVPTSSSGCSRSSGSTS